LRLADVERRCAEVGARVEVCRQDVRDADGMTRWITGIDRLDVVFACAGITGGTRVGAYGVEEDAGQVRRIMATNVDGVVNTVLPALEVMRGQRGVDGARGHICAIASVAGFVSYPSTPAYCASKAAVDRFMVATGAAVRAQGVFLTSVCCGFVDTPMVAGNRFPMPGLVSVDAAVTSILRGVTQRKRRVVFPRWLVAGSRFMDLLPIRVAEAYYQNQPVGRVGTMAETGSEPSAVDELVAGSTIQ